VTDVFLTISVALCIGVQVCEGMNNLQFRYVIKMNWYISIAAYQT